MSKQKKPRRASERELQRRDEQRLTQLVYERADLPSLGITYSRPHLHRLVKAGLFPAPVALSGLGKYGRKAWHAADIEAWVESRKPAEDAAA